MKVFFRSVDINAKYIFVFPHIIPHPGHYSPLYSNLLCSALFLAFLPFFFLFCQSSLSHVLVFILFSVSCVLSSITLIVFLTYIHHLPDGLSLFLTFCLFVLLSTYPFISVLLSWYSSYFSYVLLPSSLFSYAIIPFLFFSAFVVILPPFLLYFHPFFCLASLYYPFFFLCVLSPFVPFAHPCIFFHCVHFSFFCPSIFVLITSLFCILCYF